MWILDWLLWSNYNWLTKRQIEIRKKFKFEKNILNWETEKSITCHFYENKEFSIYEVLEYLSTTGKDIIFDYHQDKKMEKLPEEIWKFSNITSLSSSGFWIKKDCIRNEWIKEISTKILNLTKLKNLDLSVNNITTIPEEIWNLIKLESIVLFKNKIQILPDSIGKLINLKCLSLWVNNIKKLPKSIGDLINLNKLDLQSNSIKELPESIGNLTNLTEINLWRNNITELPEWILRLTNLKKIELRWNKLNGVPNNDIKWIVTRELYYKDLCEIYQLNRRTKTIFIKENNIFTNNINSWNTYAYWKVDPKREKIKEKIFIKYGKKCCKCRSIEDIDVHHKLPRFMWWKDILSNLQVLCRSCHEKIHWYKIGGKPTEKHKKELSQKLNIISQAIKISIDLKIRYEKKYDGTEICKWNRIDDRIVTPIEVYYIYGKQYLKWYCHLRKAERNFRISRILDIEIID